MKPQIDFRTLACVCKYSHWAYDENHETIQACNHKDNRPPHNSWGECCEKDCPLLRSELQKPLTLEELKQLPTPCVAILEDKVDMSIRPVTIWRVDDLSVQFRGDCGLWLDEYGNTKRLWMCGTFRNPTDEERSAAEWE